VETDELEAALKAAAKAAKDARRAMMLTALCVMVAIAVLAIDNGIKRAILSEASEVREIFRQFKEATDGLKAAIEDPAASSDSDGTAGDVAEPARASTATDGDASNGTAAKPRRASGTRARP
jgi:hypothetical protein